jgi:hypothetical protein
LEAVAASAGRKAADHGVVQRVRKLDVEGALIRLAKVDGAVLAFPSSDSSSKLTLVMSVGMLREFTTLIGFTDHELIRETLRENDRSAPMGTPCLPA